MRKNIIMKFTAATVENTYITPVEIKEYIKTTYLDTGKMTETKTEADSIVTKTLTFDTVESKVEWLEDATLLANGENRIQFNQNKGVTETIENRTQTMETNEITV
jgi:hypothetical protein